LVERKEIEMVIQMACPKEHSMEDWWAVSLAPTLDCSMGKLEAVKKAGPKVLKWVQRKAFQSAAGKDFHCTVALMV
jgi:hypothetical protein